MDWSKGFSSKYIVTTVDPDTWGDSGELEVLSGTIDRDSTTELLESASLEVMGAIGEQLVRVYLIARQGGETVREALFTGLPTSPSRNITGQREENTLDCYSILKIADDILLPLGYYAAAGSNGGQLIERLLSDLPGKVTVMEGSPALTDNIVAGDSDSKLRMAREIADAIDWVIRIDGRGEVYVEPKSANVAAGFDSQIADAIEPQVMDARDLFGIPNVLRVTMNNSTATVRDDKVDSDYSTVGRGREIWKAETVSTLSDNESLGSYTMRRLKELQAPARTLTYNRRFNPDVVPGSLISITYPKQGLSGTFRVESQSITLGANAQTQETAIYET